MTHLFLWESTDELHRTLLLPGGHGVVHGCESGVIDLDFIRSVLGFGFLCNKQATFREDAFPKKKLKHLFIQKASNFCFSKKTYMYMYTYQIHSTYWANNIYKFACWSKNNRVKKFCVPDITYIFCL